MVFHTPPRSQLTRVSRNAFRAAVLTTSGASLEKLNSKLHFSAGRGSARCSTFCREDDHRLRRLFSLLRVAGAFDIRYLRYRAPPREQLRNRLQRVAFIAIPAERDLLLARAKRERVVQDEVEKANRRPTDRPTRHPSLLI